LNSVMRAEANVLLSYSVATVVLFVLTLLLTRDILTSLGLCISTIAWWGPFGLGAISENQLALTLLLVATPILVSMALSALISKLTKLDVCVATYISMTLYYVVGTAYFYVLKPSYVPDIDFTLALPLWLSLLAVGVAVSCKILNSASKCLSLGLER
jgi:hypothetical protein